MWLSHDSFAIGTPNLRKNPRNTNGTYVVRLGNPSNKGTRKLGAMI